MRSPLWSIPITSRPSSTPSTYLHAILFTLFFNLSILILYFFLLLLSPLRLLQRGNNQFKQFGKEWFGRILVCVGGWFVGTEFVVSFDRGKGEESDWVERDKQGRVRALKLPEKAIWIANHQTLADWLFIWEFFYLTRSSSTLYIALKSSLRKIPVIGQACQWFGFVFLERNWVKDRDGFERQLDNMARDANSEEGGALDFLLFPEGTIVTDNTRGISSRFAEKTGLKDFSYTLLPRSTGLFFALRQLAIRLPTLELIDLTIGYPLPRHEKSSTAPTYHIPLYPSEYYNLASIFLQNVPPPELHFHVRTYRLEEIPLGDLEGGGGGDGSEEERKKFDEWLLKVWGEKDELLRRFNEEGSFCKGSVRSTTDRKRESQEDETDEEEDDDEGRIRWVPRFRDLGIELVGCAAIIAVVVGVYGWGISWVWTSAKGALVGFLVSEGNVGTMGAGCGCGKKMTGMGMGSGERIEL